jgi:hypothetical protein
MANWMVWTDPTSLVGQGQDAPTAAHVVQRPGIAIGAGMESDASRSWMLVSGTPWVNTQIFVSSSFGSDEQDGHALELGRKRKSDGA